MDAGIASTLLFVYPIMVAVIMAKFFHEKITFSTTLSILLALGGIAMLYKSDGNETLMFTYEYGVDIDECHNDLRAAMETAKLSLPDDVDQPTIIEMNMNSMLRLKHPNPHWRQYLKIL